MSKDFHIAYADKEYSIGDYGRETFTVGNARVRDLQFGIGLNTTSSEGIMGIGYNTNEVQVDWLGKEPYPNLVDLMVEQGHIQSRAYSLWLNDLGNIELYPKLQSISIDSFQMLKLGKSFSEGLILPNTREGYILYRSSYGMAKRKLVNS